MIISYGTVQLALCVNPNKEILLYEISNPHGMFNLYTFDNIFHTYYRWEEGEWSACSTSCGRGTQTRQVVCKQRVSDSINLSLSDTSCRGTKPITVRTCNEDKPCVKWKIGEWSQVSICLSLSNLRNLVTE